MDIAINLYCQFYHCLVALFWQIILQSNRSETSQSLGIKLNSRLNTEIALQIPSKSSYCNYNTCSCVSLHNSELNLTNNVIIYKIMKI